jgi:hypothetical protein
MGNDLDFRVSVAVVIFVKLALTNSYWHTSNDLTFLRCVFLCRGDGDVEEPFWGILFIDELSQYARITNKVSYQYKYNAVS